MRILSTSDVESILTTLTPSDLLASQAQVFKLFSAPPSPDVPSTSTSSLPVHAAGQVDRVQLPPRMATFSPEGRTLYMPSYVDGLGSGVKVLTRTAGGMKTNMMLIAPEGGIEAVVECKALTAVRNAAGELGHWGKLTGRKCLVPPGHRSQTGEGDLLWFGGSSESASDVVQGPLARSPEDCGRPAGSGGTAGRSC